MAIVAVLALAGGAQAGLPELLIIIPGGHASVGPSFMAYPCQGTVCADVVVGAGIIAELYLCAALHEQELLYMPCKDATMEACRPVEAGYNQLHEAAPVPGHGFGVRAWASSESLGGTPYPFHPFELLVLMNGHALPLDPMCSEQGPSSAGLDPVLMVEGGANGSS